MALSAADLATAIHDAMVDPSRATGAVDGVALADMCSAIAEAVVQHITTHASVVPTLLVAPPGGGPVTGTGTVA